MHSDGHSAVAAVVDFLAAANGYAIDPDQTGVDWLRITDLGQTRLYPQILKQILANGIGEAPLAYVERLAKEKPDMAREAADVTRAYLDVRYGESGGDGIRRLESLTGARRLAGIR